MECRDLSCSELHLIGGIDRSEHISEQYTLKNGKLTLLSVNILVSGFDLNELKRLIQNQVELLEFGGRVIGAYEEGKLVGVTSVDKRLFGESGQFAKMDILYVNTSSRGTGIGTSLVKQAKSAAKDLGAKQLYISATPTKSTVDFYLNLDAELLQVPDSRLYKLEPEDIHLQLSI